MAPTIEREPGTGPYEYLAVVQTDGGTSLGDTLFVTAPAIRNNAFHTYNTGNDLHKPEYEVDIESCSRGDHVRLVFTESRVTDGQFDLTRVEPARVTDPSGYETFDGLDEPKQCPQCGERAHAVVSGNTGTFDEDHACDVSPERLSWFGISGRMVYVH